MSKLHTLGWSAVLTALPVSLGVASYVPGAPVKTLEPVDLSTVVIDRAAFCDSFLGVDVRAALGDVDPVTAATWEPGQLAQPGGSDSDLVNEWGCQWSSTRAEATAWVFAPEMTQERAQELAVVPKKCESMTLEFGAPGVAYSCQNRAVARGLFGDAWLSCEVSGTDAEDRLEDWCRAVARAASS